MQNFTRSEDNTLRVISPQRLPPVKDHMMLQGQGHNCVRRAEPRFELPEGTDVTLIATGLLVAESIRSAETLEAEGISARVIAMHTIKPLDRDAIAKSARETGAIVCAEEHLVDSGQACAWRDRRRDSSCGDVLRRWRPRIAGAKLKQCAGSPPSSCVSTWPQPSRLTIL
jgi:transketolase